MFKIIEQILTDWYEFKAGELSARANELTNRQVGVYPDRSISEFEFKTESKKIKSEQRRIERTIAHWFFSRHVRRSVRKV